MSRASVTIKHGIRVDQIERDYTERVGRALNASVQLVRTATIDLVQRSPKTGISYKRRNITHKASAPGEPPATDTGFLVSQIFAKVDVNKLGAQVESRAPYSKFLEFGTVNMEARPFLMPAFEQSKPRIKAIFAKLK
jgi:HK97 gp10 family phage protein